MKRGMIAALAATMTIGMCACSSGAPVAEPSAIAEPTETQTAETVKPTETPSPTVMSESAEPTGSAVASVSAEASDAGLDELFDLEAAKVMDVPIVLGDVTYMISDEWTNTQTSDDGNAVYGIPTEGGAAAIAVLKLDASGFAALGEESFPTFAKSAIDSSSETAFGISSVSPASDIDAEYAWTGTGAKDGSITQLLAFGDTDTLYQFVVYVPIGTNNVVNDIWLPFARAITYKEHPVLRT